LTFLDIVTRSGGYLAVLRKGLGYTARLNVWTSFFKLERNILRRASMDFVKSYCQGYVDLINRSEPLVTKTDAFVLLPNILVCDHADVIESVLAEVSAMVINQFPVSSREYEKGTVQFTEFITALDKILEALYTSKSPELLMTLVPAICREPDHIHEANISAALAKYVVGHMVTGLTIATDDNAKKLLDAISKLFQMSKVC